MKMMMVIMTVTKMMMVITTVMTMVMTMVMPRRHKSAFCGLSPSTPCFHFTFPEQQPPTRQGKTKAATNKTRLKQNQAASTTRGKQAPREAKDKIKKDYVQRKKNEPKPK